MLKFWLVVFKTPNQNLNMIAFSYRVVVFQIGKTECVCKPGFVKFGHIFIL